MLVVVVYKVQTNPSAKNNVGNTGKRKRRKTAAAESFVGLNSLRGENYSLPSEIGALCPRPKAKSC